MNLSRNNHYVPRMYLKNWATNEKIKIYDLLVSDKNVPLWRERSIKKTAFSPNLYIRIENGEELDDFEHDFDAQFESPAVIPFCKICKDEKLTADEWKAVSEYIGAQYVRTLAFQQKSKELDLQIVPRAIAEVCNKIKNIKSIPKSKKENSSVSKLLPVDFKIIDEGCDDMHTGIEISTIIGKSSWLFSVKHFLNKEGKFMNAMRDMKWSIIKNQPEMNWPTTDNPVVICMRYGDKLVRTSGIANKDTMILMPINPHIVLIGKLKNRLDYRIAADRKFSYAIKEIIVKNAFLQIYSNIEDYEIEKLRPRVIDADEFKRINEEYNSWHNFYKEYEGKFL